MRNNDLVMLLAPMSMSFLHVLQQWSSLCGGSSLHVYWPPLCGISYCRCLSYRPPARWNRPEALLCDTSKHHASTTFNSSCVCGQGIHCCQTKLVKLWFCLLLQFSQIGHLPILGIVLWLYQNQYSSAFFKNFWSSTFEIGYLKGVLSCLKHISILLCQVLSH